MGKFNFKEQLRGLRLPAVSAFYALGSIGGAGYALYNRAYLIAAGVIALAAMSVPYVVKCFKEAMSDDSIRR